MKYYKLALKYLTRKKTKAVILLLVLTIVNSMILGTSIILRATNESKENLQEKTNAKIVAEISNKDKKINDYKVNEINKNNDVANINRMAREEVFPISFYPISLSNSSKEDNLKIVLQSYDDLEKDSPFSERQYKLASGNYIKHCKKGAVINENLAIQNGIKIGDFIEIGTKDEEKVSVKVIGIFKSTTNVEKEQPSETTSINRIENQIFIDNFTYKKLFKNIEFDKICVYSKAPKNIDMLENHMKSILGNDIVISTSDTLYQQMSAPLDQVSRVAKLMLILTLISGTVILSLLLCMWMQTRQKEIAVFMSLGKTKVEIFKQALLESGIVFTISILIAGINGSLLSEILRQIVYISEIAATNIKVALQIKDIGMLFVLGGVVILIALSLSIIPILKAKPKDILAKMEG